MPYRTAAVVAAAVTASPVKGQLRVDRNGFPGVGGRLLVTRRSSVISYRACDGGMPIGNHQRKRDKHLQSSRKPLATNMRTLEMQVHLARPARCVPRMAYCRFLITYLA